MTTAQYLKQVHIEVTRSQSVHQQRRGDIMHYGMSSIQQMVRWNRDGPVVEWIVQRKLENLAILVSLWYWIHSIELEGWVVKSSSPRIERLSGNVNSTKVDTLGDRWISYNSRLSAPQNCNCASFRIGVVSIDNSMVVEFDEQNRTQVNVGAEFFLHIRHNLVWRSMSAFDFNEYSKVVVSWAIAMSSGYLKANIRLMTAISVVPTVANADITS